MWFTVYSCEIDATDQPRMLVPIFSSCTKLQNRLCICAPESRPIPMRVNVQLLVANKEFFSPKRKDRGPQNCKSERPGLRAYGLWQQCLRASKSRSLDDLSCNAFGLRRTCFFWALGRNWHPSCITDKCFTLIFKHNDNIFRKTHIRDLDLKKN